MSTRRGHTSYEPKGPPTQTTQSSSSDDINRYDRVGNIDIDHPLRGVEIEAAVKLFAVKTGLQDLTELIIRGATLAEDPQNYSAVEGLTEKDKAALRKEDEEGNPVKILWHLPRAMWAIILTCCLSAITSHWPAELGLDLTRNRDIWLFGFINACSFFSAALAGVWLSDPLAEYLTGRRPAIFIAAVFSFVTVIGSACCQTWEQLLVCRLLLGIGLGCRAALVPIFGSETAPAIIRGGIVLGWDISITAGGILGSVLNLALLDLGRLNWRLQLAAPALPPIAIFFLCFLCPESPRFLIRAGKWRQAYESLKDLNDTEVQAARELYLIHVQNQLTKIKWYGGDKSEELLDNLFPRDDPTVVATEPQQDIYTKASDLNKRINTYLRRLTKLFTIPRIRRATTAALVMMISQQLCGINLVGFYGGTILPPPASDDPATIRKYNQTGLWLGFGSWSIQTAMVIPAFLTIDRWGRRTLCLITTPLLGLCLFAAGLCFYIEQGTAAYIGSLFFLLFTFSAIFEPGLGVCPFVYSSEAFPTINREAGMSFAVFINAMAGGVLGLFVPFLQSSLGALGLFELFAGLNVIAWLLIFVFVYETTQEPLERLDSIFEIPTGTHLKYQITTVVPWAFRNCLRSRNKSESLDSVVLWYKKRQQAQREPGTEPTEMDNVRV